MDCDDYREALSARLDGEELEMPAAALDAHIARCASCRSWAEGVVAVNRAIRVHVAEQVPDLTAPIMAAMAAEVPRPTPAGPVARLKAALAAAGEGTPPLFRFVLALIAATQVAAALPALFGNDLGATIHVAHEQGAWGLALAAGLAVAAWKPSRAAAMLPVLAVFVACLGLMTAFDISAGRVAPSAEMPHLMTTFGLALVWLEAHPPRSMRPGLTPGRRAPGRQVAV